ncbi:MAG: polyprenol monophosphomannose synthase [Candidatus Aminicenantales bacterium]
MSLGLRLSVILPTYNERENIGPLVRQIYGATGEETEVIVVDDDSPDRTWAVVEAMRSEYPNLKLIRRRRKSGLVSALNEGIANSSGEVVAWMDCDLSMPPSKLRDLCQGIVDGYDMAIGSRFVPGGGVEIITGSQDTALAFFMSYVLNFFIQRLLGKRIKDYTSGFIALRRSVLDRIPLRGDYGEYFIELSYRALRLGYRILEIPYLSLARRKGTSKTGTHFFHYLKRGSKYVWRTLKLKSSGLAWRGERRNHGQTRPKN